MERLEQQKRELNQKLDAVRDRIDKKMPLEKRDKYNQRSCPGRTSMCEAIGKICEEVHAVRS